MFSRGCGDREKDKALLPAAWHDRGDAVIGLLKLGRVTRPKRDASETGCLAEVGSDDDDFVSGFSFVWCEGIKPWRFTEAGGSFSCCFCGGEFWSSYF